MARLTVAQLAKDLEAFKAEVRGNLATIVASTNGFIATKEPVALPDGTLQFPNAPTGGSGSVEGPAPMKSEPTWEVGMFLQDTELKWWNRKILAINGDHTEVFVDMPDGDEIKTMWVPVTRFTLIQ